MAHTEVSAKRKTLLVTDVPPSRKYSGALLTYHLCKNFDSETLSCFFPISRSLEHLPIDFPFEGNVSHKTYIKRMDGSYRFRFLPKCLRFFSSFTRELYRRYVEVPRIACAVRQFVYENNVDRVWIILQGQSMIWLAETLIRMDLVPIHIQVWDSPSWWIKARGMDRFSAKLIKRSYNYCLENAKQFASASFPMALEYKAKYSKPSHVFIGTIPLNYIVDVPMKHDPCKFVIGLAGQIYATETFKGLIEALDEIYWEIDGKKVEIRYWGYSHIPSNRSRIIGMGYVEQDKITKELSACDMLYCPYWFEPSFKEECETSFPSKLVTYLASSTIVFFHGPGYSSPVSILRDNDAGICCTSNDPEVIKLNLRKVLYAPNRQDIIVNAKKLLVGPLGEDFLHSSFRSFIGIPAGT